jgi:hypothetical protein
MSDAKIVITAESAQAEASMRKLGDSAQGLGRKFVDLTGLAGGLAGALSVTAFASFVQNTINGIDALNDLSDATGASIENLSALEDIAARTGTSFDTVGTALVKFNKGLNEARPNSQMELNLRALGLSADELRRMDPAEALRKTAVALSGFADDANKARLVQEMFGKSVKEVAPLLKDLAEGGELQAKVTAEQAAAAEAFNRQLFELKKNATDAGRSIVSDLLPSIMSLFKEMNAGMKNSEGFFDAIFTMGTINPFRTPAENMRAYRDELEKLNKTRADFAARGLSTKAIDADINDLTKKLGYLKQLQADAALQGSGGNQSEAETKRLTGSPAPVRKTVQAQDEQVLKASMAEAEKLRQQDIAGWVKYADAVLAEGDRIDEMLRKQIEDENKRQADSELAYQQGVAQRLAQIQTANMSEQELARGNLAAIQADLEAALNQGFITRQQYNELLYQETIKSQAALGNVEAQGIRARMRFEQMTSKQKTQSILGDIMAMTNGVATQNRAMFNINKVAGIANATISTYEGVSKTMGKYPYPFNLPLAALHLAAGLAQIQQIKSAQFGSSTSAPSIAGGAAVPVFDAMSVGVPGAGLQAPNANIEPPRQQVNLAFQGSTFSYQQIVDEIIPKINEAAGNGVDIVVTRA